jgi:hypothetical protein
MPGPKNRSVSPENPGKAHLRQQGCSRLQVKSRSGRETFRASCRSAGESRQQAAGPSRRRQAVVSARTPRGSRRSRLEKCPVSHPMKRLNRVQPRLRLPQRAVQRRLHLCRVTPIQARARRYPATTFRTEIGLPKSVSSSRPRHPWLRPLARLRAPVKPPRPRARRTPPQPQLLLQRRWAHAIA